MQHFIATYGYVAIFLLMLLESACIPVPSELIMTFGGALAAGAVPGTKLNLAGVIIAGVAGNVAGSYVAWAVGRYGGQPALRRWGRRLRIREHDLDRATAWFDRYGPRAVLIGRLLPVVRTFISLPAGIAGMDPARFGIYTTLGCIPWTAALAYAGYAVGANWHSIVGRVQGPDLHHRCHRAHTPGHRRLALPAGASVRAAQRLRRSRRPAAEERPLTGCVTARAARR